MVNVDNLESYCALFYFVEDAAHMESKDGIQVNLTLTQCLYEVKNMGWAYF